MPPFRGVFPKKGAKKQGPLSLAEKRPLCVLILLLPDHPQPSQKQDTVQCSLAVEVSALAASNLIQLPDIIQHQFAVLFIQLCVLSDLVADVGESSLPASSCKAVSMRRSMVSCRISFRSSIGSTSYLLHNTITHSME